MFSFISKVVVATNGPIIHVSLFTPLPCRLLSLKQHPIIRNAESESPPPRRPSLLANSFPTRPLNRPLPIAGFAQGFENAERGREFLHGASSEG